MTHLERRGAFTLVCMAAGLLIAAAIVLVGCAAQPTSANFARADGRPADSTQLRLVLAQCKGEGAKVMMATGEGAVPYVDGIVSRTYKEADIVSACMAKHGYLAQ